MGEWIDEVARAVASGVSRRTLLRRLTGGIAGAFLASILRPEGATARGPEGNSGNCKFQIEKCCREHGLSNNECTRTVRAGLCPCCVVCEEFNGCHRGSQS